MQRNQHGFTLPEILVVTGVLVLVVIIAASLLRPREYIAELNSAQRHTDVARLAQALQRYKAANGRFPTSIPLKATPIGSDKSQFALCHFLVPAFMKDLPLDPEAGSKYRDGALVETEDTCDIEGVIYTADYSIKQDITGGITISAPSAQQEKVEITIH